MNYLREFTVNPRDALISFLVICTVNLLLGLERSPFSTKDIEEIIYSSCNFPIYDIGRVYLNQVADYLSPFWVFHRGSPFSTKSSHGNISVYFDLAT